MGCSIRIPVFALASVMCAASSATAAPITVEAARKVAGTWLETVQQEPLRPKAVTALMSLPFAYGGWDWQWLRLGSAIDDRETRKAEACRKRFGAGGTVPRAKTAALFSCAQYATIGVGFHEKATWVPVTVDALGPKFASMQKAIARAARGRQIFLAQLDDAGSAVFVFAGADDRPLFAGLFVVNGD